MRTFKMQYIKNGRDGVMLVAAKDRWDAIKIFLIFMLFGVIYNEYTYYRRYILRQNRCLK